MEVDVVWQRLVLRREVGPAVFQEPPFHSILIFLLLPPGEKQDHGRLKTYFEAARVAVLFFTGFMSDNVRGWM